MDNTFSNKPTMAARAEVIKLIRRLELTDYENKSLSKLVSSSLIESEREKEGRRNAVLYCKELDKYFKSQREAAGFFWMYSAKDESVLKTQIYNS